MEGLVFSVYEVGFMKHRATLATGAPLALRPD